jgi:hypothetical protein
VNFVETPEPPPSPATASRPCFNRSLPSVKVSLLKSKIKNQKSKMHKIPRVYRGPNGLTGTREGTMPLSTYVRPRPRSRPPLPDNHRKATVACGNQRKLTETRPEFNQIQANQSKFNLFAHKAALKNFA